MALPRRLGDPLLLPPRSYLYPLLPCALESAERECFTSYVNRLTWSYQVPVLSMLQLIADQTKIAAYRVRDSSVLSTFGQTTAMLLNGVAPTALPWIEGLQALTGEPNLQALTIGGWGGSLYGRHFLRKTIAWCPRCYNEMRAQKKTIYQPLIWMIASATMCIHHHLRLVERCGNPKCDRLQRVLQIRNVPLGNCVWCSEWLGSPVPKVYQDEREWHWNQWLYQVVGEMMMLPPEAQHWDRIVHNMALIAEHLGGTASLAKLVGLPSSPLTQWLDPMSKSVPTLNHVFYLAYALGHTPKEFMEEQLIQEIPTVRRSYWILKENRTAKIAGHLKQIRVQVRQFLDDCLEGKQYWVSTNQLARTWDVTATTISAWYPAEVTELTKRRNALLAQDLQERQTVVRREVEALLQSAWKEKRPLSRKTVATQVSYPSILRNSYAGRAFWHDILRQNKNTSE